jgi:hypothetical protein
MNHDMKLRIDISFYILEAFLLIICIQSTDSLVEELAVFDIHKNIIHQTYNQSLLVLVVAFKLSLYIRLKNLWG